MKAEKFSENMNNINDKYIEEAANYNAAQNAAPVLQAPQPQKNGSSKGLKVWRIIAIAACALLVVGIAGTAIGLSSGKRSDSNSKSGSSAPAYNGAMEENEFYAGGDLYTSEAAGAGDAMEVYTDEASREGITSGQIGSISSPMPAGENAKIIYTARLSVETTEFEAAQKTIEEITAKHGGYFEAMEVNNNSSSYRNAYYQIRIPAEELDAFLSEAPAFGNITTAGKNADDVSEYYYDTEARLESARAKLQRLQELYAEAQNMSDIITIENEISSVQWEIDNLSGTLKHYDSQILYSTVTLNLNEVYKITEETAPMTFGERMAEGFKEGLKSFGSAMEDLAVWFAASWIWILLVVIVIGVVVLIVVRVLKKENEDTKKKEGK